MIKVILNNQIEEKKENETKKTKARHEEENVINERNRVYLEEQSKRNKELKEKERMFKMDDIQR